MSGRGGGPKRYFDAPEGGGGGRSFGGDRGRGGGGGGFGGRGRGGPPRDGGGRGGGGGGRGGRGGGRGGRDGGDRSERPNWEEREKKEPFKPKAGFIATGLKSYIDTAEAAQAAKKEELSEGWKDKTTTHTTLHLTHLPSSLTSPQLSLLCSAFAPLRSAFVVSTSSHPNSSAPSGSGVNAIATGPGRDRTGKGTSRGFGYVRFVLRTDADRCLAEWGGPEGIPRSVERDLDGVEGMEGIEWGKICGKGGIKMDWAKKKLKEGEVPEGGGEKKFKKPKAVTSAPSAGVDRVEGEGGDAGWGQRSSKYRFDPDASRTVIVQGIPLPGSAAATASAASEDKDGDADNDEKEEGDESMAVDGAEGEEDAIKEGVDASVAAQRDWKKALRQKAKKTGEVESCEWPVELPSGETVATIVMPTPRLAHELMKKIHNHVLRGIIVSAAVKSSWDLVQKLGRAKAGGRLVVRNLGFDVTIDDLRTVFSKFGSLHSITLPVDQATGIPRGFAFVYYLSKSFAEAALKAVNGTRIYSGMAKERVESEGGKGGKKKEVREKKKAAEKELGGGGGERGRVVAVDWALGKDEYKKTVEEEEKDSDAESGSEAEGGSDEEDSEEESDEEEEDDDSDLEPIAVGAADDEDDKNSVDDDDDLDEEPKAPETQKGTTLFVRNIVFEATEAEVYDLFKAFGPVRYARIVYDSTTKRSRGTAFVCFWNDEDAYKVIQASAALNAGVFGEVSNKRDKNASLLLADPGAEGASALTLHGRVLAAVAAVSKDDADKLREDRDKQGAAKTDRRNLYLMREGVIFPSWAIAQTLHPSDIAARQASFDARKGLLRSNPSLYISRTRLSVRQIPLYVSDGMMKRLANYAMKEFDREVKGGHQKALTKEELDNTIVDASGVAPAAKAERVRGIPASRVRQAKILRQSDRVDPLTGLGRSKGYGFLELASHADALRVLRWANANRDVGALFRGWWRETLESLIAKEESATGKVEGKGIKVKDRGERVKKLQEKMAELVEEEELAKGKAAKREKKGLPTGEGGRSSKCLIIEFSIENQVTTKRRAEKAERSRERARRAKDGESDDEEEAGSDDQEDGDEPSPSSASPNKKRKANDDAVSSSSKEVKKKAKVAAEKKEALAAEDAAIPDEPASKLHIGNIIGKKRRQQKAGKR